MGKYESAIGFGCILAVIAVAISVALTLPPWPMLIMGFAAGFFWTVIDEKEDARAQADEELFWSLVGLKVAATCGWDQRGSLDGRSSFERDLTKPRHQARKRRVPLFSKRTTRELRGARSVKEQPSRNRDDHGDGAAGVN